METCGAGKVMEVDLFDDAAETRARAERESIISRFDLSLDSESRPTVDPMENHTQSDDDLEEFFKRDVPVTPLSLTEEEREAISQIPHPRVRKDLFGAKERSDSVDLMDFCTSESDCSSDGTVASPSSGSHCSSISVPRHVSSSSSFLSPAGISGPYCRLPPRSEKQKEKEKEKEKKVKELVDKKAPIVGRVAKTHVSHCLSGMSPITCTCKKNRCLKLYCVCFQVQQYCNDGCKCSHCFNTESNKAMVEDAIQRRHGSKNRLAKKMGCNCQNTHCMKRYCVCFASGVACSWECSCTGCKNEVGLKLDHNSFGGTGDLLQCALEVEKRGAEEGLLKLAKAIKATETKATKSTKPTKTTKTSKTTNTKETIQKQQEDMRPANPARRRVRTRLARRKRALDSQESNSVEDKESNHFSTISKVGFPLRRPVKRLKMQSK